MTYFTSRPQKSGFSLIETLVAITILLLVVVGPLSISSRTAKSANFASEQAIAHFLAQEGLELAQKAKDDLVLEHFNTATDAWVLFTNPAGTYGSCQNTTGCGLVMSGAVLGRVDTPVVNCASSATACALWESNTITRPVYRHSSTGATSTPYSRVIRFDQVSDREIRVTSEVTWRTGTLLASQRVRLVSYLFNVYDSTP